MPKRKIVKRNADGSISKTKIPHKFRIGTRKNGKSAHSMTEEQLKSVAKKYKTKADKVLQARAA